MEMWRVVRQRSTKILTFSLRKVFDVPSYHCSCSSSRTILNKCFKCGNQPGDCNRYVNFSSHTPRVTTMSTKPKIIVIGAGAAGIAAASRLLENGVHNISILEAESRIGGRIHSVEFAGGMVDLGAQWCHGEKDNIVYELVKDLDLVSSSFNNYTDFTFYLSDGTTADKSVTDRLLALANDIAEDEGAAKKAGGTFGDYLTERYNKEISNVDSEDDNSQKLPKMILDFYHKICLCLDSCESWYDISSTGPYTYKCCDGDLYLQWQGKGFHIILDVLMKKIPDNSKQVPVLDKLLLNKNVNRIEWDSKGSKSNTVSVYCSDGSSYTCDHLITTVSLGVLKTLHKNFEPPLPNIKQETIRCMEIGAVKKIILNFPNKWWDDLKGFSFLWSEEDRNLVLKEFPFGPVVNGRSWLEDVFGFYPIDSHPTVLLGWVVGPMVGQIELLSDDYVLDGCVYLLKHFLGDRYNGMRPNGILRSKWKTNPHFGGVYTYTSIESQKKGLSHKDLATPVANSKGKQVLLFAGEGTHTKFFSTVHGAIETGFREAERILKMYKSPKLIYHKVAIVGAGMAGLAAATTLQQLGCTDFVIVEAQDRPGGRIHSLEIDGNILELGAQWIHGKHNPLYELALQNHLLSDITSEEGLGLYIRDNGEIIDKDIVKKVDFTVGKILNECEEFVGASDYPHSVGEFVEQKFLQYLNESGDSDDVKRIKLELLDWHVRFQVIDNSCFNLTDLSARNWGQYVCIEDQAHINLNCGYNRLVEVLVDNLPNNCLLLGTPVAEVHYLSKSSSTKLICENGLVINCDHIILTPSLGVLKQLKITPPFPQEISQSIHQLGFHGIGKIFLIFNEKWWDVDGFQFIWRKESNEKSWVKYIQGFDSIVHGSNVLLGWVGGKGVQAMEDLSEEDVGKDCLKLLRKFVRDRAVPKPVRVVRTTWLSNPWIRGGYSHITTASDRSNSGMHKLSDPIFVDGKPRILIAGEAVHSSHYSTTHGAYESGQKQAELLASYIMKNKL